MKTLKFLLFIFFVCFVETVSSQISITKTVDMSFGNIAVIGSGTVILDPSSSRTRTGGVTLPAITGTVTAASFTVSGIALHTYSITLPLISCTISNGGNSMIVDTFTSYPSATGTLSGSTPGIQTLNIGATLHVGGAQTSGTYISGSLFTITVNYN